MSDGMIGFMERRRRCEGGVILASAGAGGGRGRSSVLDATVGCFSMLVVSLQGKC